jgi:alpha-glucoside transport system substrate-binding protein
MIKLRYTLLAFAATAALFAASAQAADKFPVGQDTRFSWKSFDDFKASHQDLAGQKLTIWDSWTGEGDQGDKAQWEMVVSYFKDATGIDAQAGSSKNYEEQARIDLQAGSPPDILILPQPGLLADFAKQGYLTDLGDDTTNWLTTNYAAGASWAALGQYEGKDGKVHQYGFPYKQELKSLVWYSPDNFKEKGYQVPKTMEDLLALTDKIVADGGTPWCIGIESGGATGWPATDWMEDLMLRTQAPDVYDGWVKNTVKFNDPRVIAVMDIFGSIAKDDKKVAGGAKAVATTSFGDSPRGLFTVPPQCYMHRQASFIASFFPKDKVAGQDYDFFYFPPYAAHPELGNPVLGSGNIITIAKDSPAARAFVDFLKTPIAHEIWMAQTNGAFLSALKSVNTAVYSSDALRKQGEILLNATTFRFDGSDLMPGPIGAGAFWTGMTDYVNGKSAKDVADQIQAAWDKL